MKLGELWSFLGHGKDRVKVIESDMTDESMEWVGSSPEVMDREVESIWAVNRSDIDGLKSGLGDFIVHVKPMRNARREHGS